MGKALYAFNRIREPSSLAAISAMLVLVGMHLPPDKIKTVVDFLTVVFGVAGVWVKEGAPETRVKGFG